MFRKSDRAMHPSDHAGIGHWLDIAPDRLE